MEVDSMKKLLQSTQARRKNFIERYSISKRYYLNENDIRSKNNGELKTKEEDAGKESKNHVRADENRVR